MMEKLKTLLKIADELGYTPRTLRNHIKKDELLSVEIKSGAQPLKKQKLIYEKLGYPPEVNKTDYENV